MHQYRGAKSPGMVLLPAELYSHIFMGDKATLLGQSFASYQYQAAKQLYEYGTYFVGICCGRHFQHILHRILCCVLGGKDQCRSNKAYFLFRLRFNVA